MSKNIFLTGPPGIGKTSIIKRIIKDLTPLIIHGFYREEIIENNICKGFRIITLELHDQILGHIYIEGPHRVEGYGVNIEGFEKLVLPQLKITKGVDLFIIDEIGRMECLSRKFCEQVKQIINSPIPLIATMAGSEIPEIFRLKQRKDVSILQVTNNNKDYLWKNVFLELD